MSPEESVTAPVEEPAAADGPAVDVPVVDVPDLARLVAELGEAVRAHLESLGGPGR